MSVLDQGVAVRSGSSGARLRQERQARNWSQARTARELRALAPDELTSDDNLVRNLKRWEAGTTSPSSFFQELLAGAFGTDTTTLFPAEAGAMAGLSHTLAEEVSRGLMDAERDALAAQLQQMRALMDEMTQSVSSRFTQIAATMGIDLDAGTTADADTDDDAVAEQVSASSRPWEQRDAADDGIADLVPAEDHAVEQALLDDVTQDVIRDVDDDVTEDVDGWEL